MCNAYALTPEKKQYFKDYYADRKDVFAAYYEANKTERINYQKKYANENAEQIKKYQKTYRSEYGTSERIKEQKRNWARKNRMINKLKKADENK